MGKMKELAIEMMNQEREQEMEKVLDADYLYQQYLESEERNIILLEE